MPFSSSNALLGRDADLAALEAAFATEVLITLAGPAGIGKSALLQAFMVRAGFDSKDRFTNFKKNTARRNRTLFYDDIDAELDAIAAWLTSIPPDERPRVMIASREPLGIATEHVISVHPVVEASAIAILGGDTTDSDFSTLARALERNPLLLVLAREQLGTYSPRTLLERQADWLDLLVTHRRDVPLRHAAYSAAIGESWKCLMSDEQDALAQSSFFESSFTLGNAEELIGALSAEPLAMILRRLVTKSLITKDKERFAMSPLMRAYARRTLDPSRVSSIEDTHASTFLKLAEKNHIAAYGPSGEVAMSAFEQAAPDLLAAHRALRKKDSTSTVRLAVAMGDYLLADASTKLRDEILDATNEQLDACDDRHTTRQFLILRAKIVLETGQIDAAKKDLARALDLAHADHDKRDEADARRSLGWVLLAMADLESAEREILNARDLHEKYRMLRGQADAICALAFLRQFQGRSGEALSLFRDALAIHIREQDRIRERKVLSFMDLLGYEVPHATEARDEKLAEQATAFRHRGEHWKEALTRYREAVHEHRSGRLGQARDALSQARAALVGTGVRRGVAVLDAHLAALEAMSGEIAGGEARFQQAVSDAQGDGDPGSIATIDVLLGFLDLSRATKCPTPTEKSGHLATARERLARAPVEDGSRYPEVHAASLLLEEALDRLTNERPNKTAQTGALRFERDTRIVTLPSGETIDLSRHSVLWRLFEAIATQHRDKPGTPLSTNDLVQAGWPDEKILYEAGHLRVYTAIRRLRKLGLGDIIETQDDGYRVSQRIATTASS